MPKGTKDWQLIGVRAKKAKAAKRFETIKRLAADGVMDKTIVAGKVGLSIRGVNSLLRRHFGHERWKIIVAAHRQAE